MDTLRQTFEANVFGVVAVTNAMLPLLQYAKEFAGMALKFNAVTPGYCATDLNGH